MCSVPVIRLDLSENNILFLQELGCPPCKLWMFYDTITMITFFEMCREWLLDVTKFLPCHHTIGPLDEQWPTFCGVPAPRHLVLVSNLSLTLLDRFICSFVIHIRPKQHNPVVICVKIMEYRLHYSIIININDLLIRELWSVHPSVQNRVIVLLFDEVSS